MRLDYISYATAVVFFIITLTAVAYSFAQQQVWIVTTAVLGLAFVGLGYTQRPKSAAAPITANVAEPPFSPPQQQLQEQETTVVVTTTAPQPAVIEPLKLEEEKLTVEQLQPPTSVLTEVRGIGEKRAAQLKALGINNIKDLENASPKDLATKLNVSPKITMKWVENAKELGQKP